MSKKGCIYCFRASYQPLDFSHLPQWLSFEVNWQGYQIMTLPWIADVARLLGDLEFEDTPQGWSEYLASLGLENITPVCCEDLWEDKLYY
jgi:hypothetical protein